MLRKLRVKFVALTMACISIVLVASLALICFFNYHHGIGLVHAALDNAIRHTIKSDQNAEHTEGKSGENGWTTDESQPRPPKIGGDKDPLPLIPVAVYTTENGKTFTARGPSATASLANEAFAQVLSDAFASDESFEETSVFGVYFAKETIGGTTYLAFADAGFVADWKTFAFNLSGIGLGTLLVFFAVSVFFSRWALKPVKDAWKSQRQFIADASHELKTPLTVILANASILLEHPENTIEQEKRLIESTQEESRRMKELVEDMLSLARLDEEEVRGHGDIPLECAAFDEIVQKEVLQFESVAFEKSVELELGNVEPANIQGSPQHLEKLVSILVDNGCKYAGVGGTVTVELCRQNCVALLKVHDNGLAIAEEDLPHIFDRFWRADRARNGAEGSYGLGLSIAQQIASAHEGEISVESSEEAGTTFTVLLPLA